jgi:hypothetical protein
VNEPFDIKRLLANRGALLARIELAMALERPQRRPGQLLVAPPAPASWTPTPSTSAPSALAPPATAPSAPASSESVSSEPTPDGPLTKP